MTVSLEVIKWLPPLLKKEKTVFNGSVGGLQRRLCCVINLGKDDKEG